MKPTLALLQALIDLDVDTGLMIWKERPLQMFKANRRHSREHACHKWNAKHAGKPALRYVGAQGYRRGRVLNVELKACWVVWMLTYGEWPKRLDHINGDKSDDRIQNLRDVSAQENSRNCKRSSANTTGVTGVAPLSGGKWRAFIGVDGKQVHLGSFTDFNDAVQARRRAEMTHGHHQNHGRAP